MHDVINILERARDRIKNESDWFNGVPPKNTKTNCVITALDQNIFGKFFSNPCKILNQTAEMMGYPSAVALNDYGPGHSSVLTLYNLAIQFVQEGVINVEN